MATKIVTKNSSTASAVPTASDLVQGELAVNVADKRLFTEDNGGAIVELGTNPSSLTVTGEITANGGIALGDNDKATFGNGDDLEIYHDGSHSYISDTGQGDLRISGSSLVDIKCGDDIMFRATEGGSTQIRYDGSQKLATTSTGINVTGTATMDELVVGASTPKLTLQDTDGTNQTLEILTSGSSTYYRARNNTADGIHTFGGYGGGSYTHRLRIDSNGDISFYEDTGTTAKFFWDASAESLGIGTSSPSSYGHSLVVAKDAAGGATYATITNTNANQFLNLGINADVAEITWDNADSLAFGTTAASTDEGQTFEAMRIDSSGNVGIGTDSPSQALHVSSASDTPALFESTDFNSRIEIKDNGGSSFVENRGGILNLKADSANAAANSRIEFSVDNSEKMRIDSSGNLLVGKTSPVSTTAGFYALSDGFIAATRDGNRAALLNRLNSDGTLVSFQKNDTTVGSIGVTSSATSYNTSSDQRLKENIADADDAGSKIDAIQVRKYDWKADGSHQDYGMIAQELLEVAPEAVSVPEDSEEMMGVDYSKLVPMLIKEIQSLRNRVAQLETGE
jgi:hypothetical protein